MVWRQLTNLFSTRKANAVEKWMPYVAVIDLSDDQARRALTQSGLSHGRESDIAFVRQAIGGNKLAADIDLRRSGTPASIEILRELGLRANAIITMEYLSILTETGLADPVGAAQFITSAYRGRLAQINALGRLRHASIFRVRVVANNMAAGPCAACLALAQHDVSIDEAPYGPLPECPHPSQCQLHTYAVLDLD